MKKQDLINLTKKTHKASRTLSNFSSDDKNKLLKLIHVNIYKNRNNILKNNKIDIQNSKDMNKDFAFIDRLTLTEHKIELMLNGIEIPSSGICEQLSIALSLTYFKFLILLISIK